MTVSASGMPLVSVILPTHNRRDLIGRSVQSILAQTYENFELIVVDDASTDKTHEVIEAFEDPRIRYIQLKKNHRAAGARNVGIDSAKGELIAFQDDDDLWLVEKLEKQVYMLAGVGATIGLNLCGHICLTKYGPKYVGGDWYFRNIQPENGFTNMALIATPGWLVRKTALDMAGYFDARMRSWDDWELSLRLSEVCEFSHLDEPLYIQDRVSGGAMWSDEKAFSNDMQVVMDRHRDKWTNSPSILSWNYYIIGRSEAMFSSPKKGRPWLWRALRNSPMNHKAWGALISSYLGRSAVSFATHALRYLRSVLS